MKKLVLPCLFIVLTVLAATSARAQANLTSSGGMNTPLTLRLNAPVTYVITTAVAQGRGPLIVFQGLGNYFNNGGTGYTLLGSITLTVNNGTASAVTFVNSGMNIGSLGSQDAYLGTQYPGAAIGDTVTLSAGFLQTNTSFGPTVPGGSFQTFLIDGNGNKLDAVNGVAGQAVAPEPSAWAMLGLGAVGAGVVTLRRWRWASV